MFKFKVELSLGDRTFTEIFLAESLIELAIDIKGYHPTATIVSIVGGGCDDEDNKS